MGGRRVGGWVVVVMVRRGGRCVCVLVCGEIMCSHRVFLGSLPSDWRVGPA